MRPEFSAKGLVLDIVEGNCLKMDENKKVVVSTSSVHIYISYHVFILSYIYIYIYLLLF